MDGNSGEQNSSVQNSSEHNTGAGAQPEITMDYFYGCIRVNGVLCPQPISAILLDPSQPPPPPLSQQHATPNSQNPGESSGRAQRKKGGLRASRVVETKQFLLTLLKGGEQEYFLEMREVATGNSTHYKLVPYEKLGYMKIEAKEVPLRGREVFPVTEEVYETAPSTYGLSLKERLEGTWTTEIRARIGTSKTEKFYFHEKVNKTLRSFNDVATFIIYGAIY